MTVAQNTILVPVDFSDGSAAALRWAADLADATGGRLVVLHVVHDPGPAPAWYRDDLTRTGEFRSIGQRGREILAQFIEWMRKDVPGSGSLAAAETNLVIGLPPSRIVEFARDHDVDHIVMGSQGRTGLRKLLLGSKAEQVVRLSPVPVTVVKLEAEEPSA